MKIKSKAWYIENADKLLREIVFERDNNECYLCNGTASAPHHWYITKGAGGYAVRWIINNVITVCMTHHNMAHGIFKPGGAPGKFINMYMVKIGVGHFKKIVKKIEAEHFENKEAILKLGMLEFCRREYERLVEVKKVMGI